MVVPPGETGLAVRAARLPETGTATCCNNDDNDDDNDVKLIEMVNGKEIDGKMSKLTYKMM